MNKKNLLWVALLSLGGCAAQPALVGPLPYDFRVVRVEDARPDDDAKLMSVEAFGAEKLIAAWQRQVARSIWGGTVADLAIRVTQFETTHSGQSYAMSLVADLAASQPGVGPSYRSEGRRVVAQAPAQCMVVGRSTGGEGGTALMGRVFGAAAPQPGTEGAPNGLAALTPTGRNATLWQELWNQCARQLATQFTQALLAGAPAAVPDTRGR